jgi:hypothetical protein
MQRIPVTAEAAIFASQNVLSRDDALFLLFDVRWTRCFSWQDLLGG